MKMKKNFLWFLGLAALLNFSACSKDEPTTVVTTNPTSGVKGTLTKCESPNWVCVGNTTLSSMSVFIDEAGLPTTINSSDKLAAFVNGECRGVATLVNVGDYSRFSLSVWGTDADEESTTPVPVEIRYYSTTQGGSYAAKTFDFIDGAIKGNTPGKGNGFVPEWK